MRFENGSQRRGPIWVTLVLLISTQFALPGDALSVAQESPSEARQLDIQGSQDYVAPRQLQYTILVIEAPTEAVKAVVEKWNLAGQSRSSTTQPNSSKSLKNAVVPASFATTTTNYECRISDALSEEQVSELARMGKVISSPKIVGENGAEVNVRVGRDVQFVASYVPATDENGNESATMQPVVGTIHDGIKLGLTGALDDKKENVQLGLNFRITEFKGMGTPITLKSKDGPLTVHQPEFRSSGVQRTFKAPINTTFALYSGPVLEEAVVQRGVPLIGRVPYVGKLFKNTAKATDSISTIIQIRCQEHLANP